tara:strand:+ start:115 stop:522 length:408 start_codon:yes stop_codon:yes gene_type:complete
MSILSHTEKKIYLGWHDVESLVDTLCTLIQDHLIITSVHGISRGGLIPAVMVSHKLNIPYVDTPTDTTLIIDDICDSGKTLKHLNALSTATLHHKPHTSCYTPTIWSATHLGDEWIIYPWELKESETIQDYKLLK